MTENDQIYAALTSIFNDVFMRQDMVLTASLSARDVAGWDSFKQIEILLAVEEHFSIKLSTREIDALKTVGDLADAIAKRQ